MKYAFIKAKEVAFPVNVMCQLLEVSRSGYCAWKERPEAPIDAAKVAAGSRGRSRPPAQPRHVR